MTRSSFGRPRDALAGRVTEVATLFLTCGVQGAGKTTLARRLEQRYGALRLTADEWLHDLGYSATGAALDAYRDGVERVQWRTARRVLELGCDVVLDWGLWAREERDHYRLGARAVGARVVLCVLDPPEEEIRRRLSRRNAELPPGTFGIFDAELAAARRFYQHPTPEELALFDPLEPAGEPPAG
ncbi:AAA family ATPase [Micromonospora globispora]|uniref:AAA family ATPase n=1 Tax=Micromonospora globispora TaxID=1450148 RepID=UPI001A9C41E2|nr:AAA family ATPase [Micromonospora globispora]